MIKALFAAGTVALLLVGSLMPGSPDDDVSADLDAFWAEVSRTVAEGDYEGYAATYHADAVLVNGMTESTYPIAQALDGWKQGFLDTKEGRMKASVEFRFSKRLSDATTAHETGIFHYSARPTGGELTDSYIHLEALLVNKGGWKMMMEYQKAPASMEEWNALK